MAESNSTENIKKKAVRVPRRPLKDYSSRPQRPITLKTDLVGMSSTRTGRDAAQIQAPVAESAPARPKKKTPKKQPADSTWTLSGVSIQAREAAEKAAKQEGLMVDEWLDRLILKSVPAQPPTATQREMEMPLLQEIRERLERIEQQHGTASRFWYWLTEWVKQLIQMGR